MLQNVIIVGLQLKDASIVRILVIVCSVVCFISCRVMAVVGFVLRFIVGVRLVGIAVWGVLSVRSVISWIRQVRVSHVVTSLSKGVSSVPPIQPAPSAWLGTTSATQPTSAYAAT